MNDPLQISEGIKSTSRLSLYTLHSSPGTTNAPPVLFLGGSNSDLRLKRAFLDSALAEQCEIITYEPRGIGRSEQPPGPWSMADYALDAVALLDATGWSKVAVIGESFGGMTALHLALMAPERVSSLVIAAATAGGACCSADISTQLHMPPEAAASESLRLQDSRHQQLHDQDPDAFRQLVATRLNFNKAFSSPSVTSGGYAKLLNARATHDCIDQLHQINTKVTVIAGRYDRQAPFEFQQELAATLPNARFHAFDAGHNVLFGNTDAAAVALSAVTGKK